MELDAIIFGGGAAGLWTLDRLSAAGRRVALLEAYELGRGQTIGSQGIIHGGMKYSLAGMLTSSAESIRDMPDIWRRCLEGERIPNLSKTKLRSSFCYLWRTESFAGRIGMLGARMGLRVAPQVVPQIERPPLLWDCTGPVARLDEQVISPGSFLENLRERNRDRLLQYDPERFEVERSAAGDVASIEIRNPEDGTRLTLRPRTVVLAAGAGNEALLTRFGQTAPPMQRRPLHMVLLRGRLPVFNGHCVDGSATRATITSEPLADGRVVWQVGGQISESGVFRDEEQLIASCRSELLQILPGLDLEGVEWSTYRVDRAEAETAGQKRPDDVHVSERANVVTAWPTKLALVPAMARRVAERIAARPQVPTAPRFPEWPRPRVADAPWQTCRWYAETAASRAA